MVLDDFAETSACTYTNTSQSLKNKWSLSSRQAWCTRASARTGSRLHREPRLKKPKSKVLDWV